MKIIKNRSILVKREDSIIFSSIINKKSQYVFIMSIIFGIVIHLLIITNKIYTLDYYTYMHSYGGGTVTGRWVINFLNYIMPKLGYSVKVPQFIVLFSIIILSISNIFLFDMINIRNKLLLNIAICSTMASPALVNTFYFGFTSHIYALAVLLIVLSAYYLIKYDNIVASVVLSSISMGIYQAYIPYLLCLYIILLMSYIIINDGGIILRKIINIVFSLLFSFIIYFLIFKILNIVIDNGYIHKQHGISDNMIPSFTFNGLFSCIVTCYTNILKLVTGDTMFSYNNTIFVRTLNGLLILLIAIMFLYFIYSYHKYYAKIKGKTIKIIFLILLFSIFPIAINFMFVMTNNSIELTECRVAYSYIFLIIFLIFLIDFINSNKIFYKIFRILGILVCILILFDQICLAYRSYYILENNISIIERTANDIANDIVKCEGYDDNLKVIFIGSPKIKNRIEEDNIVNYWKIGKEYELLAVCEDISLVINMVSPMNFSKADKDEIYYYKYSKFVADMPEYPKKGYIVKKDNNIIVKLNKVEY